MMRSPQPCRSIALALAVLCWRRSRAWPRASRRRTRSRPGSSDQDFWTLVDDVSEPNGSFRSDNLLSNELQFQHVIPELTRVAKPGRAYLGVGPEQNFTYIASLKPSIAFIVDIRRGNLDLHLLYKALFELSDSRAEFVGLLFSRPRPSDLTVRSSAKEIFDAYASVAASERLYTETMAQSARSAVHHPSLRAVRGRSAGHRVRVSRVLHVRPRHQVLAAGSDGRHRAADLRGADGRDRRARPGARVSRHRRSVRLREGPAEPQPDRAGGREFRRPQGDSTRVAVYSEAERRPRSPPSISPTSKSICAATACGGISARTCRRCRATRRAPSSARSAPCPAIRSTV